MSSGRAGGGAELRRSRRRRPVLRTRPARRMRRRLSRSNGGSRVVWTVLACGASGKARVAGLGTHSRFRRGTFPPAGRGPARAGARGEVSRLRAARSRGVSATLRKFAAWRQLRQAFWAWRGRPGAALTPSRGRGVAPTPRRALRFSRVLNQGPKQNIAQTRPPPSGCIFREQFPAPFHPSKTPTSEVI